MDKDTILGGFKQNHTYSFQYAYLVISKFYFIDIVIYSTYTRYLIFLILSGIVLQYRLSNFIVYFW